MSYRGSPNSGRGVASELSGPDTVSLSLCLSYKTNSFIRHGRNSINSLWLKTVKKNLFPGPMITS